MESAARKLAVILFCWEVVGSVTSFRPTENVCHHTTPSNSTLIEFGPVVKINITALEQSTGGLEFEADYYIEDECNGKVLLVLGGVFYPFDLDPYYNFYTVTCQQTNPASETIVGKGTRFVKNDNLEEVWGKSIPEAWKNRWGNSYTWQNQLGSSHSYLLIDLQRITANQPIDIRCIWTNRRTTFGAAVQMQITGCPAGMFGPNCDQQCNCTNDGVCHTFYGDCMCPLGYTGKFCDTVCSGKHYGQNCGQVCHCGLLQVCHHLKGCTCDGAASLCSHETVLIGCLIGFVLALIIITTSVVISRHFGCPECKWETDKTFEPFHYITYQRGKDAASKSSRSSPIYSEEINEKLLDTWGIHVDNVTKGCLLGQGAFAHVYRGQLHQIKRVDVAVKLVKNTADEFTQRDLISEFLTLVELGSHPNVVKLFGILTAAPEEKVCHGLVLEFMGKGSLLNVMKTERKALSSGKPHQDLIPKIFLKFVIDIASGMMYMASLRIIHRDLAARNILVSSTLDAKIGDFGLARDCYLRDLYKFKPEAGKKLPWFWMSPESMAVNTYTTKSDVWSFGILLWEICSLGRMPYSPMSSTDLLPHIQAGNRLRLPSSCPKEWYDMIHRCWSFHPARRPGFQEVHQHFKVLYKQNKGIPDFSSLNQTGLQKLASDCRESPNSIDALSLDKQHNSGSTKSDDSGVAIDLTHSENDFNDHTSSLTHISSGSGISDSDPANCFA